MSVSYEMRTNVRARRLSISVYQDGRVVVSVPRWAQQSDVERFVASKSVWVENALNRFRPFRPIVKEPRRNRRAERARYLSHREAARRIACERLSHWNRFYNLRIGRVAIRDQRSRWGSASAKGNVNFNYRIALLPPRLVDYLIVHELCHLKEMNHSKAFWDLVAQTIPDWKERKCELHATGMDLL
ncbi:MAG TPA: SprT family zinc-dependent metalloprotease [Candidatus Paceibacterota bacterium]|jgi:Predicted metal-dependent hydrolase